MNGSKLYKKMPDFIAFLILNNNVHYLLSGERFQLKPLAFFKKVPKRYFPTLELCLGPSRGQVPTLSRPSVKFEGQWLPLLGTCVQLPSVSTYLCLPVKFPKVALPTKVPIISMQCATILGIP